MPRESLCKGVLITLKSTPGDLEVPWDPGGEENVGHEVDAPPKEQRGGHRHAMWCCGACVVGRVVQLHGAVVEKGD